MAEDKNKQALDLGSLATGGTQETEQLNDEQLDEVNGGGADGLGTNRELHGLQFAMGQGNTKLESLSSVTKSLQDMLKSLNYNPSE